MDCVGRKASNCVDCLLNRISDAGNVPGTTGHREMEYPETPAFYWLCQINRPARSKVLKRISLEPDGLRSVYLVGLLQTCAGNAECRLLLVQLEKDCTNDEQRHRVAEAIHQCDDGPCPRSLVAYYQARLAKGKVPDQSGNVEK